MTTATPLSRVGYFVTAPSDAPDDADLIVTLSRARHAWTQADHDRWDRTPTRLLMSSSTTDLDQDILLVTPWEYIASVEWLVLRRRAEQPAGLLVRSVTEWRDMIRCCEHMGIAPDEAWWLVQDLAANPFDLRTRGFAAPYPDAPPATVVEHHQEIGHHGGLIGHLATTPTLPPTQPYPTQTGTLTPDTPGAQQ